ncbi:hypothetical protein ACJD0Z_06985 [Flavobacteriaceae bacterium M23B6Z8]
MKQIKILFSSVIIVLMLVSCSNDKDTIVERPNSSEHVLKNSIIINYFHYEGSTYEVMFKEDSDGNLIPIDEIPDVLKNAASLPQLATVIDGSDIYFFKNEKEKFDFFKLDYELLLTSRKKDFVRPTNLTSTDRYVSIPFTTNNFNNNVFCFQNINFDAGKLAISNFLDLKDLRRKNFNDKIGSIAINPNFVIPRLNGTTLPYTFRRQIIFYEDINFRGRTIEFYFDYTNRDPYRYYFGHRRLRSLTFGFFGTRTWNDRISSIDVIENGMSYIN